MKNYSGVKVNEAAGLKVRICFWVLMVCLFLTVLPGSVFAQSDDQAGDHIESIANPAGTTMHIFDYSVYNSSGNQTNTYNESTGINQDHRFKFVKDHWNLDGSPNYWQHYRTHWPNYFTGGGSPSGSYPQGDYTHGYVNEGIVAMCLSTGCNTTDTGLPVLSSDAGGESLAYLFDTANPNNYHYDSQGRDKRDVYPNVNNLLMVDDDGYYFFDSNYEKTQLQTNAECLANGGCTFETILDRDWTEPDDESHRDDRPNFLPFRNLNDDRAMETISSENPENFFIGMHMKIEDFSIPQNGEVVNPYGESKPMTFEFHGDDDVWVFIDGILVGDVGGIHWEEDLNINFKTGEITVCNHDHDTECSAPTTIRAQFQKAQDAGLIPSDRPIDWDNTFDGNTFKAGTYHTLDFFYLERGANPSNLYIRYNLISTYDFTSHKSLMREGAPDPNLTLERNDFHFKLTGYPGKYTDPVTGQTTEGLHPPVMPQKQPDLSVDWTPSYPIPLTHDFTGPWELVVGNSDDGNVNFGNGEVETTDWENGTIFYYKYEELPPDGAILNADGVTYTYHGRTVFPNPDGTYTFGNMVYDLRPVYFTGMKDGQWITKTYYEDPDYTIPRQTYFAGFENGYGASGDFPLVGTKFTEDVDGINEERVFEYALRYKNYPNEDPIVTGLVHISDNDPLTDITFGSRVYLTRRMLADLVQRGRAQVTGYVDPTAVPAVPNKWRIVYTLTEDLPEYKDILLNTQSFDITVDVTDYDDGTLGCEVTYPEGGINFVNTERQNRPVEIKGHKNLQGRPLTSSDVWTYTLTPLNGGPMPAATAQDPEPGETQNNMQDFSFGNIVFMPDHLGACTTSAGVTTCESKDYYYDVTEAGSYPGVTNDANNPKRFKVTVSLVNGELRVTTDPSNLEQGLTFTNVYRAEGSVVIDGTKRVVDEDGDTREARTFTFTLTPPAGAGSAQNLTVTTYDSTDAAPLLEPVAFNTINYSLNTDGKLVINGSGSGIDPDAGSNPRKWTLVYTITEQPSSDLGMKPNNQGFRVTVTVTDDGAGHLTTAKEMCSYSTTDTNTPPACTSVSTAAFAFVNTERADIEVPVNGTKILEGRPLTNGDVWYFTITPDPVRSPNAPLPAEHTVPNNAQGTYTFGNILFTPQHLADDGGPATYYYIISETGSVPNVSNATGTKTVQVTLSTDPDTGELKTSVTELSVPAFTNFYFAEGTTVLAAKKNLDESPWPAGTQSFDFTLTGMNTPAENKIKSTTGTTQTVMQASATEANPTARFAAFNFTYEDYDYLQTLDANQRFYSFRLAEVIPQGATAVVEGGVVTGYKLNGVTYSPVYYDVRITLAEQAGKIVPTVQAMRSGTSQWVTVSEINEIFTLGEFDNDYDAGPTEIQLQGKKHVIDADGDTNETRTFTFELKYASDGADAAQDLALSIKDGQELTFSFPKIVYTRDYINGAGSSPNFGTASLPYLVGLDRATRTTDADGKLVWEIRYILSEVETTDKAIKPNEQLHSITVTVTDDGMGNLTAASTPELAVLLFENYEYNDDAVPVNGVKYIPQRPVTADDTWTYVIWSTTEGAPLPDASYACTQDIINAHTPYAVRCTTNALAVFDFGNINFTPQHLGNNRTDATYKYYVQEVGTVPEVTTSSATLEFNVVVSAATGSLKATVSPSPLTSNLTFTNNYNEPGTVVLEALKTMNLWPDKNPPLTFDFKLTAVNDAAKQKMIETSGPGVVSVTERATQSAPTAVFHGARFTREDYLYLQTLPANERYYHYTVEEVIPDPSTCTIYETRSDGNYCNGVKYDTSGAKNVYIKLTRDADYHITPHVYIGSPDSTEISPAASGVYMAGTWNNTYEPSPAEITLSGFKTVLNKDGLEEDRTFTFELKYAADGTDAAQDVVLSIKDGETKKFTFSPAFTYTRDSLNTLVTSRKASRMTNSDGSTTWTIPYVMTEIVSSDFVDIIYDQKSIRITVTVTDNGSGRLTAVSSPVMSDTASTALTFTNDERVPVNIPVEGSKDLQGRDLDPNDKWTFILWSTTEGAPMPAPASAVTCPSDAPAGAVCVQNTLADFSFGNIKFSSYELANDGRARTYKYYVKESSVVEVHNVENTPAVQEFTVTVSVDPQTGALRAESDPASGTALKNWLKFTNDYVAEGSIQFGAEKQMVIWPTGTTQFTFSLTGTNTQAIDKINASGGTSGVMTDTATSSDPIANFPAFTFTQDDYNALMQLPEADRKYTFTLKEVLPTGEGVVVRDGVTYYKGVAYSGKTYNIEVTLEQNSAGDIIPHVFEDGTEQPQQSSYNFGPFVNTYSPEDVPVRWDATKEMRDADGDTTEERTFTFHLTYAADPSIQADDDYSLTIKDGQTLAIHFPAITYSRFAKTGCVSLAQLTDDGLAERGTNAQGKRYWRIPYLITEMESTDPGLMSNSQVFEVTVTVTDDGEGHLSAEVFPDAAVFEFINHERTSVDIPVNGLKYLQGRDLKRDDKWTYILTSSTTGAPMPAPSATVTCPSGTAAGAVCVQNEYRNFAFGSIVFTPDHLADKTAANPTREKVYTYTVVEYKDPSEPETVNGITNDSDSDRTFTVTLSVDPVTDNLKAVVSPQPLVDELTFTNKYSAEGEGEILVRKELLGREWLNGDSFEFTLTGEDGKPMPACGSTAEGCKVIITKDTDHQTISFGKIKFTQPGTYTYTITETQGSISGVTYDTTPHTVTLILEDDGNGNLVAAPRYSLIKTETITNTYAPNPATAQLKAKKVLQGREWTSDDFFVFVITPRGDAPAPAGNPLIRIYKSDAATDYTRAFGDITFTKPGTYYYDVTEVRNGIGGVTYDSQLTKTLTVTVVDNKDGTLGVTCNPTDFTQAFTNTYSVTPVTGEIRVTKNLLGRQWKPGDTFTFKITASNGASIPMPSSCTDPTADCTLTIAYGDDITKSFGTIRYTQPGEYTYIVQEIVPDDDHKIEGVTYDGTPYGVRINIVDDGVGHLVAEGTPLVQTVAVTNTFGDVGKGGILVQKVLNGRDWKTGDSFSFTLTADAGTPMPACASSAEGCVITITNADTPDFIKSFGDINFTESGTYIYTVTENIPADAQKIGGVTYDTTVHTVIIKVKVNPVTGIVEPDQGSALIQTALFTNTYAPTGEGEIKVKKTFTGRNWTDEDTFLFTIEPVNNAPMPAGGDTVVVTKNSAEYTETFGKIPFTAPGEYKYTVTEVRNGIPGVTYDTSSVRTVTIKVKDDGNGNLIADGTELIQTETFTNTYAAEGEAELKVMKLLDGAGWPTGGRITFTLTAPSGTPMPADCPASGACTKTLTAPGTVSFGKATYNLDHDGQQYTYTITETVTGFGDGWTAAANPVTITVTVSPDDGSGVLEVTGNPEDFTALFINIYTPAPAEGEIKIKKDLQGREWLRGDSFTFTIETSNGAPMPPVTRITVTNETANYTETFGKIQYTEPGTYVYIIREANGTIPGVTYDGTAHTVTITVVDDGKGHLVARQGDTLIKTETITNTYEPGPATGTVKAKKVLNGRDWTNNDTFSFVIRPLDDAPAPAGNPMIDITKVDASVDYTRAFGEITFTKPGTYVYEVTEVQNGIGGITYDTAVKTVTFTVVDNKDGTLGVTSNPTDFTQTFTNTYSVVPAEGEIKVTKNLVGRPWLRGDTFTFTLTSANGTPMPASCPASGACSLTIAYGDDITKSFGTITFAAPGEYTYTVQETVPADADKIEGVTYDGTAYTVTIKVVDDGEGHIVADGTPLVHTVAVTNTFGDVKNGEIQVQKILDGRDWKTGDSFSFTLTADAGTPMPACASSAEGCVITITSADEAANYIKSFGEIEFTEPGNYIYTVTENIPADAQKIGGVTYDTTVRTVVIKVVKNPSTGKLEPEAGTTMIQTAAITNTYAPTGEGEIKVKKTFTGRNWTDDDAFIFTIEPVGTAPMPAGGDTVVVTKNSAEYTETFGKIPFTAPGEYKYTVTEVRNGIPGVTYDTSSVRTVTIKVKDDGNGNLIADGTELIQTETFTNTYAAEGEAELKVMKLLDGAGWPTGGRITFTLTAPSGTPMPADCPASGACTKTLTAPGTVSFGKATYNLDHDGQQYTYTITETVTGFGDGWTAAANPVTITVTVSPDDGSGVLEVTGNPEDFTALFINIYTPAPVEGEIKVRKDLQGRDWLTSDSFTFTIETTNGAPMPPVTRITVTNGTLDHTETFGKIKYTEPGTYVYIIREANGTIPGVTYDGTAHTVTITVVDDGKGHLVARQGDTLIKTETITNTYEPGPATGTVKAKKVLNGRDWTNNDTFSFVIRPLDDAPAPAGNPMIDITKVDASVDYTRAFGEITFTKPGTYVYEVTEVQNGIGGITYDTAVKTVTFTVVDNKDGTLGVTSNPTDFTQTFTNTYSVVPAEGEIKVTKNLVGRPWLRGDTFTFTLTSANGTPMPASCPASGACSLTIAYGDDITKSFGTITFTTPGEYTYTVQEVVPADPQKISGVTYDGTAYTVTIKVVDDGEGHIAADGTPLVQTVAVTNTFGDVKDGEIQVQKILDGREWKTGDTFSFRLTAESGTPMPACASSSAGCVITITSADGTDYIKSFGEIEFTEPGNYIYTVTEFIPSGAQKIGGITYDETEHTVIIKVRKNPTTEELEPEAGTTLIQTAAITNTYEPKGEGEIRVKKTFTGRDWTNEDAFLFTIEPVGNAPMPDGADTVMVTKQSGNYTETFGKIHFTEPGEYKYTVKEFSSGIPGVTYDPQSERTVTIKVRDDGNGNLVADGTDLIRTETFTNTYAAEGEAELKVLKMLDGPVWPTGGSITFTLTAPNGTPMPSGCPASGACTVTLTAPGIASFGKATYNLDNDGETYTYTITETVTGFGDGWKPDENPVTIKVTVKPDTGSGILEVTGTPEDFTAFFLNIYTPAPAEGEILVTKDLQGREWQNGDSFTFTIESLNGAPMPPVTSITVNNGTAAHTASFGKIPFTKPGSYVYVVREMKGSITGMTYDETEHTVTIEVVDDGKGHLTAQQGDSLFKTVTITNICAPNPVTEIIKAKKVLQGREWTSDDSFSFVITPLNDAPAPVGSQMITITKADASADYTKAFGDITFTRAGTYVYEVAEVRNYIGGITYDTAVKTLTVTVVDNNDGTLSVSCDPVDFTQTFTNVYGIVPAEGEIKAAKILIGRDWQPGDTFAFTLTAANGTPMPAACAGQASCTVTIAYGDDVTKSFGTITFTEPGEYTYTVQEVVPADSQKIAGVTYDGAPYDVIIKVIDDGEGHIVADGTPLVQTVAVTNTFGDVKDGEILVQKILDGREWKIGDSFSFRLTAAAGTPMPACAASASGCVITITNADASDYIKSFGPIEFTQPGTYIYTVTEIVPADAQKIGGITYDETEHTVIIKVTLDPSTGELKPEAGTTLIQTAAVTNTYAPKGEGEIKVKKTFTGRNWTDEDAFMFTITPVNNAPMPDGTDTVMVTRQSADFTETFGKIHFTEPGEYQYIVKEFNGGIPGVTYDPQSERTVTIKVRDDGNGNLVADGTDLIQTEEFTNTYSAEGAAVLKVKKELAGADWPAGGSITFTLTAPSGTPMPASCTAAAACTVTLTAPGTGSFDGIFYTLADAGKVYTYTVTETFSGFGDGWEPEENPVTVKVTVSADSGSGDLRVSCDPADFTAHFMNIYTPAAAEGEIKVYKDLQGRDWLNGDTFTFTLEGLNGAPMPALTQITIDNGSVGHIASFGTITFTEPGTYVYTVKETKGTLAGVTYDETEHTVVITITEVDGKLTGADDVLFQTVEITNIYNATGTGTIRVSKQLDGNSWPAGGSIAFILKGENGAPMPEGADGNSVVLTNAGTDAFGAITYDLDDAGKVYTYTVTEYFSDEFGAGWTPAENPVTVTVTVGPDDGSGHLTVSCDPQDFTAAFTNIYTSEGKAELKVKKELSGAVWPSGGSITFTLTAAGGAPMPANCPAQAACTVTLTAPGTASFGEVFYSLADAGKTYTYTVTEQLSGFRSGWEPEENPVTLTVTVSPDDGSGILSVSCDPEDFTALIRNIYTPEPIPGEITVVKNLSGREWKDGDTFTFTLEGLNGAPMPAVSQITIDNRTADHTAVFGPITFSEPGTYIYNVTETKGNIEGIIYDESVHTVAIIVDQDSDGNLIEGGGTVLDPAVIITNTYVVTPVCVQFGGCKSFPNAPDYLKDTEFTYNLLQNGVVIDTARTRGAGGYQFDPFIFDGPGVYRYTVEEERGDVYGIEYDTNKYEVMVTVERDQYGKLTATVTDPNGDPINNGNGMNFNNPYTASATAYIEVQKAIRGAEWPAGASVTFTLEGMDDAPMPANSSVTIKGPGVAAFDPISYGIECVGKVYEYVITETAQGFGGGWSVSPVSIPVTVTVTQDAQRVIHADVTYAQGNTVTNIFNNASIQFHGIKLFSGQRVPSNKFQFILEGSDGTYQVVSNNGAYFTFDTIWYKTPGVYTYTITEKPGTDGDITYDDTVYTVEVTVDVDANGDLFIASITGDDISELVFRNDYHRNPPPPPDFPPELPKTGFSAMHGTQLPAMPKDLNYKPLQMTLEIPSLSVSTQIVSVPVVDGEYPVTWLGNKAGALEGYGIPGEGRAILTGHNHLNNMEAGPFAFLLWLDEGDRIFLNREDSGMQIYTVYANEKIGAYDQEKLEQISAEFENSITMITCEDELEDGGYASRRVVAARPL